MSHPAEPGEGRHAITPTAGTIRQLDGAPADLMQPRQYPVEALCTVCFRPVRLERMFLAEWAHVERFTLAGATEAGASW